MDNSTQQPQSAQSQSQPQVTSQKPFWQTDVFVVLLLVFFWPAGLILMWKYATWRQLAKVLVTIFFISSLILPIIAISIMAFVTSGQTHTRSESGKAPPSTSQESTDTKVYYFEDLGNGFTRVTSPKYKCSFEFPSDLRYVPPRGETQEGEIENISFYSRTRIKNDPNSLSIIQFSPLIANIEANKNTWELSMSDPNAVPATLGGLEARRYTSGTIMSISAYLSDIRYSFSYNPDYVPASAGPLSEEKLAKEKAAFEHMIQTFKILNE